MAKYTRRRAVTSKKHMARVERENLQRKYILWSSGIVLALVFAFILYGILEQSVLLPRQPVASVNGETVTTQEFQARVRYARNSIIQRWYETYQFSQMFGDDPSTQQYFSSTLNQLAVQLQGNLLGQQVLDALIDEALIRQEAARRGISVGADELEKSIQEFFGFYREGTPTPEPTPVDMPTPTLSATQLALLPPTPTGTPIDTLEPEAELAATETQAAGETQPTDTAQVTEPADQVGPEPAEPTPTLAPSPTPTPYTLEIYQQNYSETLTYLSENLNMTEAEFRRIIENQILRTRLSEAITADIPAEQEQVWARHILVEDQETAQEVVERLQAGVGFATLAEEYSLDGSALSGGDLGWFTRDVMVEEFSDAAFALEIGEISDPVQSQFGYHIIQVMGKDVLPLSPEQLEQARLSEFEAWLTAQREVSEIETFDRWMERVPTQPSIPAELLAQVQQQSAVQPIIPTLEALPEEGTIPVPEDQ
jgi:peptidyl-prolyl cis-trans isomerase D